MHHLIVQLVSYENDIFVLQKSLLPLGSHHFFEWGGHKFPKVPQQYFCDPPIWWSKILWPPPGAIILKKYVTPNARSAENMHFGAISLNKIFIKICSHPIISWFFVTPIFLMKKFCDPQLFHGPPIRKKMIAPLILEGANMSCISLLMLSGWKLIYLRVVTDRSNLRIWILSATLQLLMSGPCHVINWY